MDELQRLKTLLPSNLDCSVLIERAIDINPPLITTQKISENQFNIKIDSVFWAKLNLDQRNLLFWNEISRIKSKNIPKFYWELVVIGIGLSSSLIEIIYQNVFSLSIILLVTGLAGYQLYQRKLGEQSLLESTKADQGAINLAAEFGYTFSQAHTILRDALKFLAKQTTRKSISKRYQIRLQVLEISAAKKEQSESRSKSFW